MYYTFSIVNGQCMWCMLSYGPLHKPWIGFSLFLKVISSGVVSENHLGTGWLKCPEGHHHHHYIIIVIIIATAVKLAPNALVWRQEETRQPGGGAGAVVETPRAQCCPCLRSVWSHAHKQWMDGTPSCPVDYRAARDTPVELTISMHFTHWPS